VFRYDGLVGWNTYVKNTVPAEDIAAATSSVQMDLSKDALTTFDLLTEVAEAREIPALVSSVSKDITSILRAMSRKYSIRELEAACTLTPRQLLRHTSRVFRKLGSEWMQYRYGIMPLIYSYRDLCKVVDRGITNRLSKMKVLSPKPTGVNLPSSSVNYIWKDVTGDIRVRGSAFQFYDWTAASQVQGVSFNPLVTAWELIPYSFVIDWFVNVGDYLTVKTSLDLAKTQFACISVRQNTKENTWAHFKAENLSVSFGNVLSSPWTGSNPPATPTRRIDRPEVSQILARVTTDSYSRSLFTLGDVRLELAPSLNWRRLLDSAVLSLNQLRKASRGYISIKDARSSYTE